MHKYYWVWIVVFFFCNVSSVEAQPALPYSIPDSLWHPLRDQHDAPLASLLEERLSRDANWRALIGAKKMAVTLVDLSDPLAARFAHVNGDEMMYAASLPKIAILLTAMQKLEMGAIEETPELMQDLHSMIRKSSNSAATRMIERVGGLEEIEAVLRNEEYAMYDPVYGGGLWVGKRYAQSSRRNPDPMKGLSHAATANQVSRFYYLVAEGRLINEHRSRQMLDILSNPGINHKFVSTLRKIAPGTKLFRKSGSWRNWHSDSALVWGKQWRRYIVVCLVEDENGEQIMRNLIPVIESVLKAPAKRSNRAGAVDAGLSGNL